jgi:hypothetical protein
LGSTMVFYWLMRSEGVQVWNRDKRGGAVYEPLVVRQREGEYEGENRE